ncbi:pre-rRNA-processing protein pno1 [Thecaphora frezii]
MVAAPPSTSTPTASTSKSKLSPTKKSAKSHLVGALPSSSDSPASAASSLPALKHRKPFGQEGSDDDDDDGDDIFEDATEGNTSMSQATALASINDGDDDDLMISSSSNVLVPVPSADDMQTEVEGDAEAMHVDPTNKPSFAPISKKAADANLTGVAKGQLRRIPIPPHRMTPLRNDWHKVYTPLVEMAGLMVRMNTERKVVEIKSSKYTTEQGMLQKGADFVKAFALGFEADDAIALLRMDDLFVDTFEIKDVKTLHGDHLSRAIGRIAGKDGRTRFAIENASRTRVVVADTKIHILGSFQNIKIARDAVVALILGSPPGKVYANLKMIGARQRQRA